MKTLLEYLEKARINEDGPGHGGPHGGGMPPHGGMPHGGGMPPHGGGHHGGSPMGGAGFSPAPAGGHHGHVQPAPMPVSRPAGMLPLTAMPIAMPAMWNVPVYSAYVQRYPGDAFGALINRRLTFADLALALDLALSPYDVLGIDNSEAVKKVLKLLAKILGCRYSALVPGGAGLANTDALLAGLRGRIGVDAVPRTDFW